MPKGKEDWQQYSFLAPELHLDIGQQPPRKKRHQPHLLNPDVTAVFDILRREKAAIYTEDFREAVPPDFNELTRNQQQIYRAIKSGEEKKAAAAREQGEARWWGLTDQVFYLDEQIELEINSGCGDCGSRWIRLARVQQSGVRGKHAGQTQLLVNDHCSCAAYDKTFKVWVDNSQIINRE